MDKIDPATWEQAVAAQVSALKATYPSFAQPGAVGDRFESAIVLVRDGAVTLDADGMGSVASRTTPGLIYKINGDGCQCQDAQYAAPNKRCAHRLAVGLQRAVLKALEDVREPDETELVAADPMESEIPPAEEPHGAARQPAAAQIQEPRQRLVNVPTRHAGVPGMETSARVEELMTALAAAQATMANPVRDTTNPQFHSRYASLAAVRDAVVPALAAHGIAVTQCLSTPSASALACTTTLWHTSGQWLSTTLVLPVALQTPQGFGSASTYARRYALTAMCVLAGEDDDAPAASPRRPAP